MDQSLDFEERAAIMEFDGLMTRKEAEEKALMDSREWMEACELRSLLKMSVKARREYFSEVLKHRGDRAEKVLKEKFLQVWQLSRNP